MFFASFEPPEASLQPRGANLLFLFDRHLIEVRHSQQISVEIFEIRLKFVALLEFPLECPCQIMNPLIKTTKIKYLRFRVLNFLIPGPCGLLPSTLTCLSRAFHVHVHACSTTPPYYPSLLPLLSTTPYYHSLLPLLTTPPHYPSLLPPLTTPY